MDTDKNIKHDFMMSVIGILGSEDHPIAQAKMITDAIADYGIENTVVALSLVIVATRAREKKVAARALTAMAESAAEIANQMVDLASI